MEAHGTEVLAIELTRAHAGRSKATTVPLHTICEMMEAHWHLPKGVQCAVFDMKKAMDDVRALAKANLKAAPSSTVSTTPAAVPELAPLSTVPELVSKNGQVSIAASMQLSHVHWGAAAGKEILEPSHGTKGS